MNFYNLPVVRGNAQVGLLGRVGKGAAQGILQQGNEGAGRAGIHLSYKAYCMRQYKGGIWVQRISGHTWTYQGRAGTQS